LSINDYVQANGKVRIPKRAVLFACTILVPFVVVFAFASISSYDQNLPAKGLVSFTCHSELRNRTFSILVEVDLADGMEREEAKLVAIKAFDVTVDMGEGGKVRELDLIAHFENGIWRVRINAIHSSGIYGPSKSGYEGGVVTPTPAMTIIVDSFIVVIDPNTRVAYFYHPLVPLD
jgi:hypothetical protein